MKMQRKLLSLALALSMAVGLTACSGTTSNSTPPRRGRV